MIPWSSSWKAPGPCSSREDPEMKGMWFNQAVTVLSYHLLELSGSHLESTGCNFSLNCSHLLKACCSLPLHRWPQPAAETHYSPLLKPHPHVGLRERVLFFSWNQHLQAVALYPREGHTSASAYGRDGTGLQSTRAPGECVLLLPGTFCLLELAKVLSSLPLCCKSSCILKLQIMAFP